MRVSVRLPDATTWVNVASDKVFVLASGRGIAMQKLASAIALGGGIVAIVLTVPSTVTATSPPSPLLPPSPLHRSRAQLPSLPSQSLLSVTVTPQTIQLGETLSVRVQLPADSPQPVVSMGDRQYPAFAMSTPSDRNTTLYRALIPSSPLDTPGARSVTVAAGDLQQSLPVTLRARTFPTQSITVGSGGLEATQIELDAVTSFKDITSPTRHWSGAFLRPSAGRISAIYGVRRYYNGVFANDYYHRGVDYAAALGTPVVAPAAGTVALVGREAEGFVVHGNTVGLDHGQGVTSIFLHLNQISVSEGQTVTAGQQIGTIGTSGASTGPHLHWGLYVHGIAVDPVPWRYQGVE